MRPSDRYVMVSNFFIICESALSIPVDRSDAWLNEPILF
jgi:hypothetical protein